MLKLKSVLLVIHGTTIQIWCMQLFVTGPNPKGLRGHCHATGGSKADSAKYLRQVPPLRDYGRARSVLIAVPSTATPLGSHHETRLYIHELYIVCFMRLQTRHVDQHRCRIKLILRDIPSRVKYWWEAQSASKVTPKRREIPPARRNLQREATRLRPSVFNPHR